VHIRLARGFNSGSKKPPVFIERASFKQFSAKANTHAAIGYAACESMEQS